MARRVEELKARLVEYEEEATELRERLQGVESLMALARALIQEEERRIRWPGADAQERVKLLSDLIGAEFGGGHKQYDLFYA